MTTTPSTEPAAQSIADIAATNGSFDILVAALDAAGLVPTFSDPGDFTVFAPTDDAFKTLATDTLGLSVEGKSASEIATEIVGVLDGLIDGVTGLQVLTNILSYHVRIGAANLEDLGRIGTVDTFLDGASFTVSGNQLIDNDPEVENPAFVFGLTDLQASNGLVQVIDRVLLPIDVAEAMVKPTIVDTAIGATPEFEALVQAVVALDLVDTLSDRDANLTVFAPTDDAFRALADVVGIDTSTITSDGDLAGALVDELGADLVEQVVLYHVADGSYTIDALSEQQGIVTLEGGVLGATAGRVVDAAPGVASAQYVEGLTDLEVSNGIIQAIDAVLLPFDFADNDDLHLTGNRMKNILMGGGEDDTLLGRLGDDLLVGNLGDDELFGGIGQDKLFGGHGKDELFGGIGQDKLDGGRGTDELRGGVGADTLDGGAGRDRLIGSAGSDLMIDSQGNDIYRGGAGADMFDFTSGAGRNVIRDFGGADMLYLSAEEFADADAVLAASSQVGTSTIIDGDGYQIVLNRVSDLTSDDILLF